MAENELAFGSEMAETEGLSDRHFWGPQTIAEDIYFWA
jgi:hypothetical protein